jgi:hypothetical protein
MRDWMASRRLGGGVMETLESHLRRVVEALGFRIDASPRGFAIKSVSGNFNVKDASDLTFTQLEARVREMATGNSVRLAPARHSATAAALRLLKRKR